MSHRRIRDRVEDELFKELRTQEEADMAQTTRTRRIVEAAKDRLAEDPELTTRQLHARLLRDGASLPKPASFAPYATQARKELGIDGRKAVNGEPQGEDPAGDNSEAGANSPTPAPPADSGLEIPDQENPTPERPSNEAQSKLERDSSFPGVAPSVDRLYFKAHRLEDGRYQIDASGPLPTIQRMVAALAEDGER